jgi:DNA-binding NarL/FixJ family response regulator
MIVDDHEIFRKGVIMSLSSLSNIDIIGEAANGVELLEKIEVGTVPDAILMDIKMPKMDGVTATKEVLMLYPNIKIIALSMFGDEVYLEKMISAGAFSFILKHSDGKTLLTAINTIANGQQYYSEEFLPYFTKKYVSGKKEEALLSKRELEVLTLLAKGYTNHEIADDLFISSKTVANHRANLISKTGSKNTVSLLSYAIKQNLIKL